MEEARCPSLDEPAGAFARILAAAAAESGHPIKGRVLEQLLYHLGRWIYLVDAVDDLREDSRTGNYNPVALRFGLTDGTLSWEARERVGETLDASIQAMAVAYELWDFGPWSALIRATVYEGLYCVGHAVMDGTFHTAQKGGGKKELL